MNPFVGRARELALLDQLWETPGAQTLILYGRRRGGKAALLAHWLRARALLGGGLSIPQFTVVSIKPIIRL